MKLKENEKNFLEFLSLPLYSDSILKYWGKLKLPIIVSDLSSRRGCAMLSVGVSRVCEGYELAKMKD